MAISAKKGFYGVPEMAIRGFEQWSGLRVCFHDIELIMTPFVATSRYAHQNPFCCLVKHEAGYEPACRRFELDRLRPYLAANPEGCAKVCHAGILEWAAPVMHAERVSVVLFAGLRWCGSGVTVHLADDKPSTAFKRWPAELPKPEKVTEEQSELYLEGLRQLAARLQLWLAELKKPWESEISASEDNLPGQRRHMIERFIAKHYQDPVTLDDLAQELRLSWSRTSHLVKEVCGRTFLQQLTHFRLRYAAGMLWQTERSVIEIAMASGYGDVSNFHKAFRKHFHMTPLQYRKRGSRR